MEIILMTNLAFSIVGFFFIFRMWREVKERRDYYGENFNIPKGDNVSDVPAPDTAAPAVQVPISANASVPGVPGMDMEQLTALVVQAMATQQQQQQKQQQPAGDGDLQKLIQTVIDQNGGA